MKPSERIREIWNSIKNGYPTDRDVWITAIMQYLDEQSNLNEQGGEK